VNEHECEPIRGLPAPLPEGEELLWQGSPRWTAMAIQAFHVRKIALYFAALMIWRAIDVVTAGESIMEATLSALWLLPLAATAIGLLALLGWLTSRATVYTITSRRVVIRFGVAISLSVNIPFCLIEAAALKTRADGTGDIPLVLKRGERISYLVAWPHVRPWRLRQPEPMLRAIPEAKAAAAVLAQALAADAGISVQPATPAEARQIASEAAASPLATAAA